MGVRFVRYLMKIKVKHITAKNIKWLSFTCVFMTIVGIQPWCTIPFLPFRPLVLLSYIVTCAVFLNTWMNMRKSHNMEYLPLYLYLGWICFNIIRSLWMDEGRSNFTEFLIYNGTGTLSIVSILYIAQPDVLSSIIASQKKWIFPLSILILIDLTSIRHFGFYIAIIQIYLVCFSILNRKTKIIICLLALFTIISANFGEDANRSTFVKYSVAFLLGLIPYFRRFVGLWVLKVIRVFCFVIPFFFVYMGIWGGYNIFAESAAKNEGKDLYVDSRTTVYKECIISAYNNNYYIIGRTPARGYDSEMELARNNNLERYSEVSTVNIFTWYGAVGLVLYSIVFWWISQKGLYRANNIYIQLMSVYVSFRFLFAWIEDFNRINAVNISLWIMMSLCVLPFFRDMNDTSFKRNMNFLNFK